MNKFEAEVKEALKTSSEHTPDYWENISKKTNIPYNGRIIMKNSPKKNIFRVRYIAPAVCAFALVATIPFLPGLGNNSPSKGNDVANIQTVENLNINNISNAISAKIRLPENGTTETISYDNYLKQANMNLNLWLPTGLEKSEDAFIYYNEDGSEFMMSGYHFSNPSTGATLSIRFQHGALPMTDLKYQLENEETSTINGEDIVIGYSKDLDAYCTTFMYEDIGYELSGSQGISQDDFVHVIQSIVQ
ncbi:MAG: hypothetical protein K0S01_2155 [Herbinix sp.]|jgi:hypothetical protein|nr:hypothetical protein [Herbinix sp.]